METTTSAPTARGVAFLATHPQLLDGAYTVSVYEDSIKIQGRMTDMCDAILALHDLDPTARVVGKRTTDGSTYTTVAGYAGVCVELVLVAAQREAVSA